MWIQRAMLAFGLWIVAVQVAICQSDSSVHDPRTRGVWHAGRFVGFVPAHERVRAAADASPLPVSSGQSPVLREATLIVEAAPEVPLDLESLDVPAAADAGEDLATTVSIGAGKQFGPSAAIWGRSEYLLWWTQGMDVPALATTSPDGTAQGQAGVLGVSTTTTIFGAGELNDEIRSGGRYTAGLWFDDWQCHGVQVTYLGLEDETESFQGSAFSGTILARPFFNTQAGEDARLIAYPGVVAGNLAISVTTEFQTLEALYRWAAFQSHCARIDYVFGYRFAELQDQLLFAEATQSLAGATAGTTIDLFDRFDTRNRFHGAEMGLVAQWQCRPCWSWEATAKIAFGGLESRGVLAGQETRTTSTSQSFPNGLLVQGTNAGTFWEEDFETISEIGITLKREIPCGMTATIGYSFIYWSDVMRSGDQIDRNINTTQIPPDTLSGDSRPIFPFGRSDFWAQGLRFGVEYQF